MPAVSLTTLPTLPYVYSATTPAGTNTCQLVNLPTVPGVLVTIHNRDKSTKALRISFDPALTQGGAAPSMFRSVDDPCTLYLDGTGWSGIAGASQLALFSDSASVNYELLFTAAVR